MHRILCRSILLGLAMVQFAFVGCNWKAPPRQSILVIAIDRLGVNQVACDQERTEERDDAIQSGLADLCDEGVRFTHAFTTSTLSAPAMASVLTADYPFRAGLRHNGGGELGVLSANVDTIPEKALRQGYRTLFVSGGAPLLRRTGLHQGFEVFDDTILPDAGHLYRPARAVADVFTHWIDSTDSGKPFFAVLHFADRQIPWQPMPDGSGRMRENTMRGQWLEIDETMSKVWVFLRKHKLWESTTVVVLGLQGEINENRMDEIPALDLHSETAHVALMIKRAGRVAGEPAYNWAPKQWSFDLNVSLADVGATFNDLLGEKAVSEESRSLRKVLNGPGEEIEKWRGLNRLVLTESAWAKWQLDASLPIRVALRRGPFLYLHDQNPTVYNTLTDAFEEAPLPKKNANTLALQSEFGGLATELGFSRFPALTSAQLVEERWARNFFSKRLGLAGVAISDIDEQRAAMLTTSSMPLWFSLKSWDEGRSLPAANACTKFVLGSNAPTGDATDESFESEVARLCPFRGAREVGRWMHTAQGPDRDRLIDAIARFDQQRATAVRVAEASFSLGRIWETGNTRRFDFEGLEVLLAQPEAARIAQAITRRNRTQREP